MWREFTVEWDATSRATVVYDAKDVFVWLLTGFGNFSDTTFCVRLQVGSCWCCQEECSSCHRSFDCRSSQESESKGCQCCCVNIYRSHFTFPHPPLLFGKGWWLALTSSDLAEKHASLQHRFYSAKFDCHRVRCIKKWPWSWQWVGTLCCSYSSHATSFNSTFRTDKTYWRQHKTYAVILAYLKLVHGVSAR